MEIQPMTPGGEWLASGGTGTPQYVTNPDHLTRLLNEGWQIVADPRLPAEEDAVEPEVAPPPEGGTTAPEAAVVPPKVTKGQGG